jgi:uncharacterized protein with FMN-binding domain
MKKALKIAGIIVAVLVVLCAIGMFAASAGLSEVKALRIEPIDPSTLADGTYSGAYAKARWRYNLSVEIAGGRIASIALTDDKMASAKKANQEVIDSVVAKQDIGLEIDAYTGASAHGKALLKAVENALSTAPLKPEPTDTVDQSDTSQAESQ